MFSFHACNSTTSFRTKPTIYCIKSNTFINILLDNFELYKDFSLVYYNWWGDNFLGGILLALSFLSLAVHVRVHNTKLLLAKKAQFYIHNKKSGKYYLTTKWRACRALQISCGNHFFGY